MSLSQFKTFKCYSFYDESIYNQIFENVTPSYNETPNLQVWYSVLHAQV